MRLLHWTMAGLVLTLLALGFAMTQGTLDGAFDLATSFTLYQWHKWIGLLVLALWLPRLVARGATQAPAALAGWQGRAARAAHGGLYVLMLAMPVTGWLATSASPLHLPLLVPLPELGPDARAYALLSTAHEILAFALIGLVALHVEGAARHALVNRDDTLRRMAP